MDAHSGATSGSESNSNSASFNSAPDEFVPTVPAPANTVPIYFGSVNTFDLTNVVKRSLNSIGRPTVHSGPLEHQLTPAIQQGNYRHASFDRLSNTLAQLLSTNDETHQHVPSATPSLGLTDNLYNSHISRRDEISENNGNAVSADETEIEEFSIADANLRLGAIIGLTVMILFSFAIFVWLWDRYQDERDKQRALKAAEEIDLEACEFPAGENILTPPSDSEDMESNDHNKDPFADPARPDPTHQFWTATRARESGSPEPNSPSTRTSSPLSDPGSLYELPISTTTTTTTKKLPWRSRLWKYITLMMGEDDPYAYANQPRVDLTQLQAELGDVEIRWLDDDERRQRRLRGPCHGSIELAAWRSTFVITYKGEEI